MIRHLIPRIFTAAAVIAVPLALAVPASATGAWHAADLTAMAKAPATASAPSGYETFLEGGQPATARTVFRTASGHIEELSLQADKKWHAADLTALAKAPAAASAPFGYFTARTGQGQGTRPFARVVYRTPAGHIEELSVQSGQQWHAADLTVLSGAPAAASAPFGYTTEFSSEPGKVARVIYRTPGSHIVELSLQPDGLWHAADLTAIAGAPAAASAPFGYVTVLNGQAMVARVVYRTPGSHIVEGERRAATASRGGPRT